MEQQLKYGGSGREWKSRGQSGDGTIWDERRDGENNQQNKRVDGTCIQWNRKLKFRWFCLLRAYECV